MPSSPGYVPSHKFNADPAASQMVNAALLDTQFSQIAQVINDLLTALGVSIRDDDTLTDALVRIRNLHPELSTYIDSHLLGAVAAQALEWLYPARVVSTVNISALSGLPTVDGVALAEGDRVLLVGQTDARTNGLWVATNLGPAVWARPADYPQGGSLDQPKAIIVREGAAGAQTSWVVATGSTVPGGPTAPVIDDPTNGYVSFVQVWGPFPMPVNRGGTGSATAAGARANLGCAGKFTTTVTGDGVTASFLVTHNLGSAAIIAGAQDSVGTGVVIDYASSGINDAAIVFAVPPAAAEQITVTIIG